jgi:chitobiase/beta-hexosaminidase-like protein
VSFWSDGAAKKRWIALPPGERISFAPTGPWRFPAGTVFVKHFEVPDPLTHTIRRIETRVLVRDTTGGVYGVTYKWRQDGSDADLVTEARTEPVRGTASGLWYFPGPQDCRTCHTPVSGGVLGVNTRQLNLTTGGGENQLVEWQRAGVFGRIPSLDPDHLSRLAREDDFARSLQQRARSYLDANCSNCHQPGGVAGNFDARFEEPPALQNLVDGPVLINLGVDHARVIAPADPWRSILLARVETSEGTRMPPLGHTAVDTKGAALLREWIGSMPGKPVLAPPTISPRGGEFPTCPEIVLTHPDPDAVIHYTLDGTLPVKSSAVYTAPLRLKEPATLRARAFKQGAMQSIAVQETFVFNVP